MFEFRIAPEMREQRKAELVKLIEQSPNADIVVPVCDRAIITEMVVSGIEKTMLTLRAHTALVADNGLLRGECSEEALLMLLFKELHGVAADMMSQLTRDTLLELELARSAEETRQ